MSPEGMITTQQAADILNITRRGVIKLIKAGILKHERPGNEYLIFEESVRQYAANRPKPGPKAGFKRQPPADPQPPKEETPA